MNLPNHRRIDHGRTHSSTYSHWCGIEHASAPMWPRVIGWVVTFGLLAFIGVLMAWRG
jgi:hypothetical protein